MRFLDHLCLNLFIRSDLSSLLFFHSLFLCSYAPWCGHCKSLAPEYEKAAAQLKGKHFIAKVDCTEQRDLCTTHGVKGFPTLKMISKTGAVTEYEEPRKADAIVKFVLKQNQPAFVVLATEADLEKFKAEDGELKLVINAAEDSTEAAEIKAAAASLRKEGSVAIFTGSNDKTVTLYRTFDEPKLVYSGPIKAADVAAWVKSESLPLIGEIGPMNFQKYIERNLPLVWTFIDYTNAEQNKIIDALTPVAKEFRDKVLFCKLDGNRWGEHAKTFGLSGTTPGVVIEDRATRKNYVFPESQAVTTDAFKAHVQSYLKGDLSATVRSQEPPANNDGPLTTVVGKTFDEIVLNSDKDVFIYWGASWCGHCKALAPKWEELANIFKNDDSVIIAKIDGTENDTPVEIQGFPTIYFYPGNNKSKPVQYSGERSTEALAKYVRENASTLKDKKEDKDEL